MYFVIKFWRSLKQRHKGPIWSDCLEGAMTTNVILIKSLKTDREISNRCQINNVLWSFLRFDFYFIATIKEEIGLKKNRYWEQSTNTYNHCTDDGLKSL